MPAKNIGIFLCIAILAQSFFSMGCGVSKKIHQSVLNDLESVKADLASTRAQKESLDQAVQDLKKKLDDLESTLAARNTELEALRQQNLELMNARNNLMTEVEDLQARTGQLTEAKNKEIEKLKGTYDSLVSELKDEIKKGEIKVTQVLDRLSVNMVEKILFDSGSAEIKPEGLKVLERLGGVLKKVTDKQIRVEGHTDNIPIGGKLAERFPTNWELSAARATNVVKFLSEKAGVDPKFLTAAAYSMNRPVASNDTKEGRAQNRRIEIALIPMNVDRVLKDLQ
jgi:chemotaxis protein MotB